MLIAVLLFYWVVLDPHHGRSTWEMVTQYLAVDSDFASAVAALFVGVVVSGTFFLIGARSFFPSGDALRCDRSTFTVSKIPWFKVRGEWTIRSYPFAEISQLRYCVIYSGKGGTFYGLRFLVAGQKQKLFTGLEAPEAHRILKGLHALGVDVLDDPDMRDRVEYTLRDRSIKLDNR